MRRKRLATRRYTLLTMALLACSIANPQGRPIDWPAQGGDAQRTGWEKVDTRITKENVKDFELVLKRKLDNPQPGPRSLSSPAILGLLISYRGFKELAFVAGTADNVWAIDADLDRIFWQRHFDAAGKEATRTCGGGFASMPALIPPVNFGARPRPAAGGPAPVGGPALEGGAAGARPRPGAAAAGQTGGPASANGPAGARPSGRPTFGGFGSPRPAFAISSDGKLHLMNTSTGEDFEPALAFVPPGSKVSSVTVSGGTVYALTTPECGTSGGVWATDLNASEGQGSKVASFPLAGGAISLHGGLALGTDETVYVHTGPGPFDPGTSKWSQTLLALEPKDLKLKQYFTVTGTYPHVTTPVVFAYKGRDLVTSAGADGRLYLLDSKSVGGDDHKTALYQTPPVSTPGNGVRGGFSSWQDSAGTRWVFAPVWGPVNPELKAGSANADASHGSIIAFKVEDKDGKTALTPAWVSREIVSPEPPVVTGGLVFALSSGPAHATLYALDAATGKELYSTGDQVTAPGNLTGLTLANGRVFFTTTDNTLYGFGIHLER